MTNSLSKTKVSNVVDEQYIDHIDQDIAQALIYLNALWGGTKKEDIATMFNITRQGLHKRVRRWENDGVIEAASKILYSVLLDNIVAKNAQIVSTWPEILQRVAEIALKSKSDYVALQAADWLFEHIIDPAQQEQDGVGRDELYHTISEWDIDPQKIITPKKKRSS